MQEDLKKVSPDSSGSIDAKIRLALYDIEVGRKSKSEIYRELTMRHYTKDLGYTFAFIRKIT